eukprot:gnl/Dysnectes_brevis/3810_a4906_1162.p1 GENE.gnl/Dysnectes_brevis/3810_a4906_1162~~gnl/Dysnectes_brevis/3810_a4906_1162.p1  ORF type:complete len:747 (+),score=108.01 gnl/Dysnectes_brevis/3810_a4906_1162:47-2242(+)
MSVVFLLLLITQVFTRFPNSQVCIPQQWVDQKSSGSFLYSEDESFEVDWAPNLGSGYIAFPVTSDYFYVAGVFNGPQYSETPTHRASVPHSNQYEPLDPICAVGQDLETPAYIRRIRAKPSGSIIEHVSFISRAEPKLSVTYLRSAEGAESATVSMSQVTPAFTDDFTVIRNWEEDDQIQCTQYQTLEPETDTDVVKTVVVCTHGTLDGTIRVSVDTTPVALMSVSSSVDSKDPAADALSVMRKAIQTTPEQLLSEHSTAWSLLWDRAPRATQTGSMQYLDLTLRVSIYDILASTHPDYPQGLSPGGLMSNAYNGHSFWDSCYHMVPTFTLTHSEIAAGVMQYRVDRLPAAEDKAEVYFNLTGAAFPWESASTGCEVTPLGHIEGQEELHISNDIVQALMQIWWVTQDQDRLDEYIPLLVGISRFWASRVWYNSDLDRYEILKVQCPDESSLDVDNNAFTNAGTAMTLNWTADFAEDSEVEIASVEEIQLWRTIADKMYIPTNKTTSSDGNEVWIHDQYEGFIDNPHEIRQADVALLQYPMGLDMPEDTAAADLAFYSNWTDWTGQHSGYFTGDEFYQVAWLALGKREEGEIAWQESFKHMVGDFMIWTERAGPDYGHLNFITGAGDYLQSIVMGWIGARITPDGLSIRAQMPPVPDCIDGYDCGGDVMSLELPSLTLGASVVSLVVDNGGVMVCCESGLITVTSRFGVATLEDGCLGYDLEEKFTVQSIA